MWPSPDAGKFRSENWFLDFWVDSDEDSSDDTRLDIGLKKCFGTSVCYYSWLDCLFGFNAKPLAIICLDFPIWTKAGSNCRISYACEARIQQLVVVAGLDLPNLLRQIARAFVIVLVRNPLDD